MKSIATNLRRGLLILFLPLCFLYGDGLAQDSCNCPTPPGGTVKCDKGLVPFCIVKDGELISLCKAPPAPTGNVTRDQENLKAWLLSIVLGKTITRQDIQNNTEYREILKKGGFITENFQVTFPKQKIFLMQNNRDLDLFQIKSDPKIEQNLVNLIKDKPSLKPS